MPDSTQSAEAASPFPEAAARPPGALKIFLGYAPGVGKTYSMLSEAIRRRSRGEDVVIGVIEYHGRAPIMALAAQLEKVPLRTIEYRGTHFEEMDVAAVVARRAAVVLVDELAHSNIPGSLHPKRYEDVQEILAAGSDVLTTLNVQHLDSMAPLTQSITGMPVRETVPDWLLQTAAEIVVVDLTPEALQNRVRRGDVFRLDQPEAGLSHFFRTDNLIALRELALQQVAEQVDRSLAGAGAAAGRPEGPVVRERLAVCVGGGPAARYLIARAARMARRLQAQLYAVHVENEAPDLERTRELADSLEFAVRLGARTVRLEGRDWPLRMAEFFREQRVTQVLIGGPAADRWRQQRYFRALRRLMRAAPAVDLHIVRQESAEPRA